MGSYISQTDEIQAFFRQVAGLDSEAGSPRVKQILIRVLQDCAKAIEDLEITDDEFWRAVDYLNRMGASQEAGLLVAGLGLEHFLDLLQDARDRVAGTEGGTPRTIEGPLYVAGAPISNGYARLDDGTDPGAVMYLHGRVTDTLGNPIAGAIVDVWHASTQGTYSYFDKSQSDYNLRRRIVTDELGYYKARSIVPSGYGCPETGTTQELLSALGRHGNRPAHIHFFISAAGHKHLTTQINFQGDEYLWDDFAYATREGLIGELQLINDTSKAKGLGLDVDSFAELRFDFQVLKTIEYDSEQRSSRPRALQQP